MMMTEEREEYWYVDVPGGTRQDWDLTLGRLCRSHAHHYTNYTNVALRDDGDGHVKRDLV